MTGLLATVDVTRPRDAFPEARALRRRVVLHVGPTNSGKTYAALLALARARRGVYAGPLRLLAHEVVARFGNGTAPGLEGEPRPCNLVTGEEVRVTSPNAGLVASTVEMINLVQRYDVAVVDEIQLVAEPARGGAWTRAVLGVRADELHLCGESAAVEPVRAMLEAAGDDVEVRHYERLSPLEVAPAALGDLKHIERGDCLVAFGRDAIFALQARVARETGLRAAVCYGALPPEVREEQARAFNSGELDVMIATDAIGMGLNLKIRRIVFASLVKPAAGESARVPVSAAQIKQIAGRAGRYGVHVDPSPSLPDVDVAVEPTPGLVTCLHAADVPALRAAMAAPAAPLAGVVVEPETERLARVRAHLADSATWADTVAVALLLSQTAPPYRISSRARVVDLSRHVSAMPGLTLAERDLFAAVPISGRSTFGVAALRDFARAAADSRALDLETWLRDKPGFAALQRGRRGERLGARDLVALEDVYKVIGLYMWLSHRNPLVFCGGAAVGQLARACSDVMTAALAAMRPRRETDDQRRDAGDAADVQ